MPSVGTSLWTTAQRGRRAIVTLRGAASGVELAPADLANTLSDTFYSEATPKFLETEIVLADFEPSNPRSKRGLDVAWDAELHLELEPQRATIDVWGLSKERRDKASRLVNEALEKSYRERGFLKAGWATLAAGRPSGFGPIVSSCVTGIRHNRDGADWHTEITVMDGRVPWREGYITETVLTDIDLSTLQSVLAASDKVLEGQDAEEAFRKAFPDLIARKGNGIESGMVMFGPSREHNRQLLRRLGLRAFWNAGRIRFIREDGYAGESAVVLREGITLYSHSLIERGFQQVRAMLDHRLMPGRQIILEDEDGGLIGAPTYRVERATHRGSTFSDDWTAELILRPSSMLGKG